MSQCLNNVNLIFYFLIQHNLHLNLNQIEELSKNASIHVLVIQLLPSLLNKCSNKL